MWKNVATILAVVLVVGFLLYRVNWDSDLKNTPTKEIIPYTMLNSSITTKDIEVAEKLADEISKKSDIEIKTSFVAIEDLRNQLLNNHIKASSLVKNSSLIPKNLVVTPKNDNHTEQNGGNKQHRQRILKIMDVATQMPHSKINEPTEFTGLPNFFAWGGGAPPPP